MGMDAVLGGMLAFLLTAAGIRLFIPVAHHYRLVDCAGDRKRHVGDIPLIGGLAMYAGLGITALWLHRYSPVDYASGVAYAGMGIMALIGFVDDMHGMPVRIRLIAQVLAGLVVTLIAGCVLTDFGRLLSSEVLALGFLSIPLTVIAFTGGVNALNMSDGLDGLAGGFALITLVSLLVIALVTTSPANTHLAFMVALIGTVSGFLLFNYRWR
jgi:UDP-GlcNAc:undecaprenyl-phosphate GlcNAc-1-phosphate transferase